MLEAAAVGDIAQQHLGKHLRPGRYLREPRLEPHFGPVRSGQREIGEVRLLAENPANDRLCLRSKDGGQVLAGGLSVNGADQLIRRRVCFAHDPLRINDQDGFARGVEE